MTVASVSVCRVIYWLVGLKSGFLLKPDSILGGTHNGLIYIEVGQVTHTTLFVEVVASMCHAMDNEVRHGHVRLIIAIHIYGPSSREPHCHFDG